VPNDALPPSLLRELNDIKRRLTAQERAPDVLAKFDRYPTTEWAAVGRGRTSDNAWSSCGIADVTGLVYDRVEVKFITNSLVTGKREAEVRLAAFRHYGNAQRECVSASDTLHLSGSSAPQVGTGIIRWVHGIPFGWEYADGTATYRVGPENMSGGVQVFAMWKYVDDPPASNGGGTEVEPGSGKWTVFQEGSRRDPIGYVTIPSGSSDDGTYAISNMHYCVGLPAERIPEASTGGWAWYIGGGSQWTTAGNVGDPFI